MRRILFLILTAFILFTSHLFSQSKKLDSLLKSAAKEKIDTSRARTYNRIASLYINLGQADSSSFYAFKGLSISRTKHFTRGQAVACNLLGQVKNYTGFSDSAVYYFSESMKYYTELKDSARIAGALNNLGVVYIEQGNISKALEVYFKSLRIKEQTHDSAGIANVCHNIASLYEESNDTANSLKYDRKALEIRRKINDQSGVGSSLVAMGIFYKNTGKTDLAVQYITEALKIAEDLGEEESIAIASYNLGSILYDRGKVKESMDLFERSLDLSRKNKNAKGVVVSLQAMAQARLRMNEASAAVIYLDEAYGIAKEMGAQDIIQNITENLSDAFEKTGDHKKALMYLKISNSIKDSLFNEENVRKLTSENLKYEHEKEKLVALKEQEKKEALASAESFRKNLIIGVSILFLILVSIFTYTIYNRLKENRRQKLIIEEQQKEMIASINYAKRIQYALLAHTDLLKQNLPEHFVLFKPKDIVSGDFYWATLKNNYFYLALCDCTGHGVPGAFMSLLNINFLNEAINEKNISAPGEILDHVRKQLIKKLDGSRDGMDAVLLRIPVKQSDNIRIEYAAANNSGMLMRSGQMIELSKDSMPIGLGEKTEEFKTYSIELQKGDSLYVYTDGFADQFGGPKGKKFKYKQLDEALLLNAVKPMNEQAQNLDELFEKWKGQLEQVDDVCVMGIRF